MNPSDEENISVQHPLTTAHVTFGKRKKIWVPFLLRAQVQRITVGRRQFDTYTAKCAINGETTEIHEELVKLDVRDPEAGIAALLDVINAQRAEQD